MSDLTLLVSRDPRRGWTAHAPGCGAAGGSAWDALAEALHRWDRAGRPPAAGIQYGCPPADAVGSAAEEARTLFDRRARHFEHPCADATCPCQRTRRGLKARVQMALNAHDIEARTP